MMHKLTFRTMLLSGVCMLPLGAMAADLGAAPAAPQMTSDNEIDFGLLGLWGKNTGQYGRYNGLTEEGLDGLFGFSSATRDAWDSGGTRYYIFEGSNINFQFGDHLGTAQVPVLSGTGATAATIVNSPINNFKDGTYSSQTSNDLGPNAEVNFSIGDQGHWGLDGYYDAISYTGNIIDSIYTVSGHTAHLNTPLMPWGGATSPTGPAGPITAYGAVAPSGSNPAFPLGAEQPVQTGTRRDIIGLTGTYHWNDWTITGAVRHEHKEGSLEETFDGAYGGTAFTLPIDYDTDRYDVSASYSSYQLQAVFGYFLSNFDDSNTGVFLPNPLSGCLTCGRGGTPSVFQQTALYATPPSNYAQYVTAMVGYNVLPSTRLNLNARYGLETQNDSYPANTGDPAIGGIPGGLTGLGPLASLGLGTSATSPDIRAQVYQGNVGITSNPIANLNASAKYSIDGRDVKIDQVGGVNGNGTGDGSASANYAYVVPQTWLKQKVNLDADYRILPQSNTKLSLGYVYDNTERSNAQVGRSDTNIGTVGLSSMLGSEVSGRITANYGDRSGVLKYWVPWANIFPGSTYGGADFPMPSGAYYQAPMTLASVNFRADYTPAGLFSGGVSFKAENDNYHYPTTPVTGINFTNQVQGIKQDNNLTAGIDGNYRPVEGVNLHAYYTYEELFFNNMGNGACSTATLTAACTSTSGLPTSPGYSQNKYTSDVQTVGFDADWQATDKLKLSADYTFSYGSVMFGEYNGVFISPASSVTQYYQNVTNYPDDNTTMHMVTLKAKYELTSNVELGLAAGWSMLRMSNWQDGVPAVEAKCTNGVASCSSTTNGNAISNLNPGYGSPNYNVGLVMAALKVKW